MFIYVPIFFALSFGRAHGEYQCKYLDQFEKQRTIICNTGCCGDVHLAYCCNRYLPEIIFGSIGGVMFLVVVVVVIHVSYRSCRRKGHPVMANATRNYGALGQTGDIETQSGRSDQS